MAADEKTKQSVLTDKEKFEQSEADRKVGRMGEQTAQQQGGKQEQSQGSQSGGKTER